MNIFDNYYKCGPISNFSLTDSFKLSVGAGLATIGVITILSGLGVFAAAATGAGKAAAVSKLSFGAVESVGHAGAVAVGGVLGFLGYKIAQSVPPEDEEAPAAGLA